MSLSTTVLLVEDDATLAELAREMLAMFGIEVLVAESMELAIENYQQRVTDIRLVIFDMNLEKATGIEVFEALKEIDDDFVSILASGMITDMDIKKYKDMGFNEIIKKPYSFKNLKEIITGYLEG